VRVALKIHGHRGG